MEVKELQELVERAESPQSVLKHYWRKAFECMKQGVRVATDREQEFTILIPAGARGTLKFIP